tara:strand:+ start:3279 stop:4787 length:1509 start_codon:yes stop_codon:yes gene_type:complete
MKNLESLFAKYNVLTAKMINEFLPEDMNDKKVLDLICTIISKNKGVIVKEWSDDSADYTGDIINDYIKEASNFGLIDREEEYRLSYELIDSKRKVFKKLLTNKVSFDLLIEEIYKDITLENYKKDKNKCFFSSYSAKETIELGKKIENIKLNKKEVVKELQSVDVSEMNLNRYLKVIKKLKTIVNDSQEIIRKKKSIIKKSLLSQEEFQKYLNEEPSQEVLKDIGMSAPQFKAMKLEYLNLEMEQEGNSKDKKVEELVKFIESEEFRTNTYRKQMAEANLRLVYSIAKKFKNKGFPMTDLIQEGNIGLMKAIDKFNPEKGNKFSTYATNWIQQEINRSLSEKAREIRVPISVKEKAVKIMKAESQLRSQKQDLSVENISKITGFTSSKIYDTRQAYRSVDSLSKKLGDEGEGTLEDVIADKKIANPEDELIKEYIKQEIVKFLGHLSERDSEILKMRYGIGYGQEHTLEEVGEAYGLTKERIRQIEFKSMERLRELKEEFNM